MDPGILDSRHTHQGELTHPLVLPPPSILTIYFRPMAEGTPVMTHMPPSVQHPACELMTFDGCCMPSLLCLTVWCAEQDVTHQRGCKLRGVAAQRCEFRAGTAST